MHYSARTFTQLSGSLAVCAAIRRASSASRCTPGSLIQCDLGRSGSAPISCGIKFLSAQSYWLHVPAARPWSLSKGWLGILSPNVRPISARAEQASKTAVPVWDRFGHWIAGHIPPPVESTRGLAHFDCASALIDGRYRPIRKTNWHASPFHQQWGKNPPARTAKIFCDHHHGIP